MPATSQESYYSGQRTPLSSNLAIILLPAHSLVLLFSMNKLFPNQHESTSVPDVVWILGAGQCGHRAAELLRKVSPQTLIYVVEKRRTLDFPDDIETMHADGIEWLAEHFTPGSVVTMIIPALPVHLAAAWLKIKLSEQQSEARSVEIPQSLVDQLPNPIRLSDSTVTTSKADFLCPPHCSEPDEYCSYTGKRRSLPLHDFLESMECGIFEQLIVRSRQFAPGVGGFFPDDLWNLLEKARLKAEIPLLVGTACKCHGIIDGIIHRTL